MAPGTWRCESSPGLVVGRLPGLFHHFFSHQNYKSNGNNNFVVNKSLVNISLYTILYMP